MGSLTIIELLNKTKDMLSQRDMKWRHGNTIMLDVFMRRERHVYLKSLPTTKEEMKALGIKRPTLREFGPQ